MNYEKIHTYILAAWITACQGYYDFIEQLRLGEDRYNTYKIYFDNSRTCMVNIDVVQTVAVCL